MNKNDSGITMVSLVITIIVLLIISGVAISQLDNGGILQDIENELKFQNNVIQNEQTKMQTVQNEQLNDWGF